MSELFSRLAPMRRPGAPLPAATVVAAPPPPVPSLAALIAPQASPHGVLHLTAPSLCEVAPVGAGAVQALAMSEDAFDFSAALFLDTETTGLAGGTGTLAFLIGVARVTGEVAAIQQAHLEGPGRERPMLQWLRGELERSTVLITFNGKSFDWPLLRSRYVMNRLAPPPELPHVDLLHCSRRVLRHWLDDVSLTSIEREVLNEHRSHDIDGSLIPMAWFNYVRTGRVAGLTRVLEHNFLDVKSMLSLLSWLCAAWKTPEALSPEIRLGIAQVAARRGESTRALSVLAAGAGAPGVLAALELKGELLWRRREPEAACEVLERAVQLSPRPARIHLRLAKLYEHQLGDMARAAHHARLASAAEPAQRNERRVSRLRERQPRE